jgi:hypothetical protein
VLGDLDTKRVVAHLAGADRYLGTSDAELVERVLAGVSMLALD